MFKQPYVALGASPQLRTLHLTALFAQGTKQHFKFGELRTVFGKLQIEVTQKILNKP